MASNEEQLEAQTENRVSVLPREPILYSSMDFETLTRAIENIDRSVFDRTRLFNPRKQRSGYKRAEPLSEEHRKMENNRNSREYTKRNRDEISDCRALIKELNEVKWRLEELLKEYKLEVAGKKVIGLAAGFENILKKYLTVDFPKLDPFILEYREKAAQVMQYEHETTSENVYSTKLIELKLQLDTLISNKDRLNSSKDKNNFATSKSRLNQRIVREQLKRDCWESWENIKTLTFRGQELQKLLNQLKKQVWDNILAAYYHLFGLFSQQKSQLDVQQIEDTAEYFTPFSHLPGRLLMKWTPLEEPALKNDGDSTALPPTADQSGQPGRPHSMMLKTLGQAPSSPSFTVALPNVPAQNDAKTEEVAQNSSIPSSSNASQEQCTINNLEISDQIETKMNRKRTAPSSPAETQIKSKSKEHKPDRLPTPVQPIRVQQIFPITFDPSGTIPYAFNPLAPPADIAPVQTLAPNFLMVMGQQRVLAAILKHAFQRCQK